MKIYVILFLISQVLFLEYIYFFGNAAAHDALVSLFSVSVLSPLAKAIMVVVAIVVILFLLDCAVRAFRTK